MKRFVLSFALIIGLLASASTAMAQTVNMSRYITLTVQKDSAIKLDFKAAAYGTPIRIVSGSNTQDITVNTSWYNGNWPSTYTVTADASTMTVYGDLMVFDCSKNGTNLTALDLSENTLLKDLSCLYNKLTTLDVSQNTQLTELDCSDNKLSSLDISKNTLLDKLYCIGNNLSSLDVSNNTQLKRLYCFANYLTSLNVSNTQLELLYCYNNNFSSQALDDIYCALPDRTGTTYGKIQPIFNSSSSNHATVLATNAANATAKNWKVQYFKDDTDITATTGSYVCPTTDIAEASAEQALTLYPNPVADVLYLSATARTVRIYNVYGTEVAHATDTDRIDVAHLPAGVYTVKADGTVAKMVKR